MDKELGYINDFINIETIINNECYETSVYTGVNDFFFSHLKETDISEKIKLDTISVFEIKPNDLLKLNPSVWALQFSKEKGLPMKMEDYQKKYIVKDIIIRFYSKNPNSDSELPRLDIKIKLEENEG
ncbi:hypothetical protein [Tenacibaculum maritimum]|uniref:hypothetical protein n=1 Tax=Tenacibaculum maritimum TaxID=107401 RepID=UPI0012E53E36|nr:hypothetical protein [Tenacibaculum maritimum]CAA0259815.1 hypothetical protein TMP227_90084 [Tenacibaculum maritimum]